MKSYGFAQKVVIAQELFESGMLCKCPRQLVKVDSVEHGEVLKEMIAHKPDCEGREEFKKLIGLE